LFQVGLSTHDPDLVPGHQNRFATHKLGMLAPARNRRVIATARYPYAQLLTVSQITLGLVIPVVQGEPADCPAAVLHEAFFFGWDVCFGEPGNQFTKRMTR
jgi:hypothetical protein